MERSTATRLLHLEKKETGVGGLKRGCDIEMCPLCQSW